MILPLLAVLLASPVAKPANEAAPAVDAVRDAVARSLPFLEREGTTWITERKCLSCHVVSFFIWSHNEAKARGVKVDDKKLDEWNTWSLDYSINARQWFKLPDAAEKQLKADGMPDATFAKIKPLLNQTFTTDAAFLERVGKALAADELDKHKAALLKAAAMPRTAEKNDGGSIAAVGQLLLARPDKNAKLDTFLAGAPMTLRKWQEANGSWKATGQLPRQNRPGAEADETTTGWAILGLASLPNAKDADIAKTIDSALAYYRKTKPGKSHESLLVHMLVEEKFGKATDAETLLQEVVKRQNADGGWGWIAGAASDAFATGQTLFALSLLAKPDTGAIARGQKYLIDTQGKDGSWVVSPKAITDPKSPAARLDKVEPIYHFWGSAWASIGLSRSLAVKP